MKPRAWLLSSRETCMSPRMDSRFARNRQVTHRETDSSCQVGFSSLISSRNPRLREGLSVCSKLLKLIAQQIGARGACAWTVNPCARRRVWGTSLGRGLPASSRAATRVNLGRGDISSREVVCLQFPTSISKSSCSRASSNTPAILLLIVILRHRLRVP
jgi:hypothetical protein